MHDQEKKLSSFGFKVTFGGPEQDQQKNFAGYRSEGTWHLFVFLRSLNLRRKGGEIRSKAKFITRVWSARLAEWGSSSNNKIVQPFGIFVTLIILIMSFWSRQIYVISMEFLAVNRRRLSSRFAHSSGREWEAVVFAGWICCFSILSW